MRTSRTIVVVLVVALAGLAGCVGNDRSNPAGPADEDEQTNQSAFVPPEPEEDISNVLPVDHPDHQNPASHTQGVGLSIKGHTDFTDLYPKTQQAGWTEVDIQGHLAAVASYQDSTGAVLVNLSDPANPTPVSYVTSAGVDQDARISEDQRFLFVACQPGNTDPAMGAAGDCQSAMPGTPNGQTSGVVAYDIADPANPEYAGFISGVNTHNIWTSTIDDSTYVFTNGVEILEYHPDADPAEAFEQVAEVPGGHDAYVNEHPVTGNQTLYTTNGNTFAIYDVSNPAKPSVLTEKGPEITGWHEQTASTTLVDGRALLVVGGEVFEDAMGTTDGSDPPMITVLDVTDPTSPKVLSQWTLPVDELPGWTNYRWSPHNIDVSPHGQVSVAWNHAGIWVFDVSTQARQEDPVTLGFYQPHEDPVTRTPTFKATGDPSIPRVWAGMLDHHGYLVVPDMYTGLYVLEPDWGLYG